VLTVTTESIAPDALRVNLLWRALADVPRNYALALRLRDVAGYEWAAFDTQTGGGYYPTHLWRPGEVVPDSYNLSLPLGTPPGDYSLTLSLYDPVTLVTLGEATVTATVREAASAEGLAAQFQLVPEIGLGQVDYPAQFTQGEAPQLMAHWLVAATPAQAYRARWTLIGAEGAAFSQTLDLAPGSSPLAWRAQAFILGHVWLGTPPTLAPGDYALELQLVDENDKPIGDVARVGRVVVLGRPRVFVVPPMQVTVGATFGDKLKLWGYNAEHTDLELRLTLVWGALTEPRADYKFFVHLFNPADEFVTKQVDMMPHDSGYATALWTAGEVVTDTVTFSLADVPPGEYQLAVGWYDPAAPDVRLPAFDAQGQRLDLDRVILPLTVTAP
jgi:hypothetical protein